MRKFILLLSIISSISISYSQVGGLSASKLGTLCADVVPVQTIEFEPFFEFSSTSNIFDNNGEKKALFSTKDSIQFFSSMGFRFSYGLFKNFEIGVSLPVDVSTISFGAKYKLPFERKFSAGLLAGYNTIIGNSVYQKKKSIYAETPAMIAGIITTYEFSDKFSFDFNAQFHKHIYTIIGGHNYGYSLSSDFGYYIIEDVNFIIGANYSQNKFDDIGNDSYLLTINPGIAIEKAKNFILVLNTPLSLLGKNEYKTSGFGLALTIMLD
ncbi:MAG: hypothetical protein HN704_09535 [Bacteroidetes bacterium]|jgi:hypothetical protein|nr:hypothetical protein [Bacteroidota bacterium]MBT7143632.1 hypothetical protein [Bacteroidota bacterium]MBT7491836.1 hypothetical protein [Bacteroidota bacterium]